MSRYKTLDFLKFPTQISYSDKLVGYLMRIAENKPFFADLLSKPLKLNLVRTTKIRVITYSNQIEGNPLNEAEVNQVLEIHSQSERPQRFQHSAPQAAEDWGAGSANMWLLDQVPVRNMSLPISE